MKRFISNCAFLALAVPAWLVGFAAGALSRGFKTGYIDAGDVGPPE